MGSLLLLASCQNRTPANDVLKVVWEAAPRTIDPRFVTDANSHYLSDLINCKLINFNQSGGLKSELAKSWTWVAPTVLELGLRTDAIFSDGSPVTNKDVKATYDYFLNTVTGASPLASAFANVKEVTAISDDRIRFVLKIADAAFLPNLMIGILPASHAAGGQLMSPGAAPGCGPYVLSSITQNEYVLDENSFYSLAEKPAQKRIVFLIVKDEITRYAKLAKGEVDIVQNSISRDKVYEIQNSKDSQLKVLRRPALNVTYLGFNFKDPVLSDVRVRRAIASAINRDEIIKYILRDMAIPAKTMLTPEDPFLDVARSMPAHDVIEANRLLDEAGFPMKGPTQGDTRNAKRMTLTYKTTTDLTRLSIARAIAQQLSKVGIEVKVQSLEWGKFKQDVENGRVQLWSLSWVGFKDPDIYRFAFHSTNHPPRGSNRGSYSNPKLDAVLDLGQTTVAVDKRKQVYSRVQEIIEADLPYVFLWHEDIFAVTSRRVQGFELYADGRLSSLVGVRFQ